MSQRLAVRTSLACLAVLGVVRTPEILAQGMPAPGPGGPALPATGGATVIVPVVLLVAMLVAAVLLTVVVADLRRKRQAQAVAIEGQIADALLREPRLARSALTAVAQVPLAGARPPSVEIRGQVEYPDLREIAVRIVRQELLRHHPDGRVEDRIFVSPPIPVGRL